MDAQKPYEMLVEENERLADRLDVLEATIEAIRSGAVDAVVVSAQQGEQVYTLEGADRPYRVLVDAMEQGVATLNAEGVVLYCNQYFARLLNLSSENVVGRAVEEYLAAADKRVWAEMLNRAWTSPAQCGVQLWREGEGNFPASLHVSRLPSGKALCLLLTDLTQQKLYEELKRTESLLRRSERELSDFFDNATIGLHWVDAEGIILRANRAELEMLDYTLDEYLGKHISQFHVDQDCINDILQRLQAGEEIEDCEAQLRRKDGVVIDVLICSNALFENGAFIHSRCFTRDISDRKRADFALRRSKEEAHRLLELNQTTLANMGEGMYTVDGEGLVTYMNPEAERLLGWQAGELLGKKMHDMTHYQHPDGSPFPIEECAGFRVRHEGVILKDYEDHFIKKDGTFFPVSYSSSPLRDPAGAIVGLVVVFQDISRRKRAEIRARLLWDAAADLLTTGKPDEMMRTVIADIAPHFGVNAYVQHLVNEEGTGLRLDSYVGLSEETANSCAALKFGQGVSGTVAATREPLHATSLLQSSDPRMQLDKALGFRAVACFPLISESQLFGTLSFASHSRDRFDAEELEFLGTIAHYVTAAQQRLRLLNQLLVGNRRKDEFLATLAHELRNPLAPIRNSLHLLRLSDGFNPSMERVRDILERQVDHMIRLVDDLLDVSRITSGKIELRKQPVDLAGIIATSVETVQPLIDAAKHQLAVSLPVEPLLVNADSVRISQIVSNLLNNAAKYTPEGGQIWLTVRQEGSDAVISVRDNGLGIPTDMLGQVFDMFAQVDRTLNRARGGLGIGLSLAQTLVAMHGGHIKASSEGVGRGSEFLISLPLSAAAPIFANPSTAALIARKSLPTRRILVVDDNQSAGYVLRRLLETMGQEVDLLNNPAEALASVQLHHPDVVISDIGMPKMDGYELARQLRPIAGSDQLVLVALSGYGQEDDKQRSRDAGFDYHLTKPVSLEALHHLLATFPTPPRTILARPSERDVGDSRQMPKVGHRCGDRD